MKRNKIIWIIVTVMLFQVSCVKDPLEYIETGEWNNERSILDIKFENQVGKAEINRIDDNTGEIIISINIDAIPDFSNILLESVQLSYGAKSSIDIGESLSFENPDKSAIVEVTSPTGKVREYTIIANSFQETLLGTYNITNLVVYGGTGPEYGGGAVLSMTSKPWIWPETGGPEAELDNTLTFILTGITNEGNTYGTIINDPGPDEMYANFLYIKDPETDVNHFYRKIPKGEGVWTRNYANGTISIEFPDGASSVCRLIEAGVQDMGHGKSKTTTDYALEFTLSGTDDWKKIYSDYDKFVKRPRRYWIDITKE
jgi:hypothetical protein